MSQFGKNIEKLMNDYDLTLQNIADIAGVTRPAVHYWIKADIIPGIDTVKKISDHFNMRVDELLSEPTVFNTLGKKLEKMRLLKGLSPGEAAKVIGIPNSILIYYEKDELYPEDEVLEKLANFYGMDKETLAGDESERLIMGFIYSNNLRLTLLSAGIIKYNDDYSDEQLKHLVNYVKVNKDSIISKFKNLE